MTYKGNYDSATQYEQLDIVRYQSAAYLALTDVIGEAPGTSAKWGLIAQDGDSLDGYATPEMYDAVGDGIADDTDAINACIRDNKIILFKNNYAINTIRNGGENQQGSYGISIPSNRTLIFAKGSQLICIPNQSCIYNAIYIANASNVLIDGLTLQADRSNEVFLKKRKVDDSRYSSISTDQGYGIKIAGSTNVIIKNTKVYNALADGVSVWHTGNDEVPGSSDYVLSENISFINCDFSNNRRDGLTIGSSKNVYALNCLFGENGLSITYPNVYGVTSEQKYINEGLTVVDDGANVIASGINWKCGVNIEPDYEHNPAENITFENCRFLGNGGYGFMDSRHSDWNTAYHKKLALIGCESDTLSLFANADFSVMGGNYSRLAVGMLVSSGIVSGAELGGVRSDIRERGKVFFVGCKITGGTEQTLNTVAPTVNDHCWIELISCDLKNCNTNEGLKTGHFVLKNCFVKQSSGRFCDSGHLYAENTEFHFEGRAGSEQSIIKVTSAEFKNCDFFYPDDVRVALFSLKTDAGYSDFNKITNWYGNRFHNSLNSNSTINILGNNVINNWFHVPTSKVSGLSNVIHIGNIFIDDSTNPATITKELEEVSNKVTSISSNSTDTQYPSAKAVFTALSSKADAADTYTKSEVDAAIQDAIQAAIG